MVRDTEEKIHPGVGKDMPKGRESCSAQWSSELKASHQSRDGGSSPVLTPPSGTPTPPDKMGSHSRLLLVLH